MENQATTVATLFLTESARARIRAAASHTGFNFVHFNSVVELRTAMANIGRALSVLVMPLCVNSEIALTLQHQLQAEFEPLCIAYMDHGSSTASVVRAMQLGAITVLSEQHDDISISRILTYSTVIYAERVSRLAHYKFAVERFQKISPRQTEILNLIVTGTTNKAIALQLKISEKTVEKHRHAIHSQTETRNLPQLMTLHFIAQQPVEANYYVRLSPKFGQGAACDFSTGMAISLKSSTSGAQDANVTNCTPCLKRKIGIA
jgi:FixJ family two-component response regulator